MNVDEYYCIRNYEALQTAKIDELARPKSLLQKYGLDAIAKEFKAKQIPTHYSDFIQTIRMPKDSHHPTGKSDLKTLLQATPFERPIQVFSDDVLRTSFALKPVHTIPSMMLKSEEEQEKGLFAFAPEEKAGAGLFFNESASSSAAENEKSNKEKKERKRKKKQLEENNEVQPFFVQLIEEVRQLTWETWIIEGKSGNPFIQKITKQNCKKLGVPTYFTFIKEPMDLTRMKEKAQRLEYANLNQVASDFDLLIANAKVFNREGEPVYQMADEVEAFYRKRIQEVYAPQVLAIESQRDALRQERKRRKKELQAAAENNAV